MVRKIKKFIIKNDNGSVEYVACLFVLLIVIVFILASVGLRFAKLNKNYVDDGITASLLASEVYNVSDYLQGYITINEKEAYKLFFSTLKKNLNLDDDCVSLDGEYFTHITISDFIVYNVKDSDVYEYIYTSNGSYTTQVYQNSVGSLSTPNGDIIEKSSAYAKVIVYINDFYNVDFDPMQIDKFVSLVGNE